MTKRVEALFWAGYSYLTGSTNDGDYYDDSTNDIFGRMLGGGGDDDGHGGGHGSFGVHITYDDLYHGVLFLTAIYIAGQVSSRLLAMPSLVGEIVAGIVLGPNLADFVPNAEAFVLLGEIGLILLVLEAGIDIDMTTLKLIGSRGILIALVGSILPIVIGIAIAFAFGTDTKGSLAAGAAFGPTSLGIAMNILRAGKIVNTPVGQLVVSAAVIDDMIALIILSQLEALVGEITAASVVIPIVSALAYLCLGGYIAITVLPGILDKYIVSKFSSEYKGQIEMIIMFCILIALMPATHYTKASFLMGAFVSGLTFCRSHELHHLFVTQFKRVLQWLMRIFFAASIGFQVPIKDFGNGTVIWQGLVFTIALTGKLAVGFMVPNFNQTKRFTGLHFRDCLITGFSMAAEGEFAFVIAVFAVDQGLIEKDLYASIVLAVLLSTIIPPFALRFTITYFAKKAEEAVAKAVAEEVEAAGDEEANGENREEVLRHGIKKGKTVFVCIQTQSDSRWGLLHELMNTMNKNGLDIIDHRSWHPRGVNTTLVNEVYAKGELEELARRRQTPEERIEIIESSIASMMPKDANVKVQRWFPGVVEEIVEETVENVRKSQTKTQFSVEDRVLKEATDALEKKRQMQTNLTKEKSVNEIMKELDIPDPAGLMADPSGLGTIAEGNRPKRRRQKMRSTPVVGGGLFGETSGNLSRVSGGEKKGKLEPQGAVFNQTFGQSQGHSAELIINGESYSIRVSDATLKAVQRGYSGDMIDSGGIQIQTNAPVVNRLQGFVRNPQLALTRITEESTGDSQSEMSDDISEKNQ
mmetsp:Transcript_27971/g.42849  ORF Transcript_27971/g.42849 Transcript_27971/m.42849 type:complete len:809 (+) Transcript_27971:202-2628(+)